MRRALPLAKAIEHRELAIHEREYGGDLARRHVAPGFRNAQRRRHLIGAPRRDTKQMQPVPPDPPVALRNIQRNRRTRPPNLIRERPVVFPDGSERPRSPRAISSPISKA